MPLTIEPPERKTQLTIEPSRRGGLTIEPPQKPSGFTIHSPEKEHPSILRNVVTKLLAPRRAVEQAPSEFFPPLFTPTIVSEGKRVPIPGLEGLAKAEEIVQRGLVSTAVDPFSLAFMAAGGIPNVVARGATGAAIGAIPEFFTTEPREVAGKRAAMTGAVSGILSAIFGPRAKGVQQAIERRGVIPGIARLEKAEAVAKGVSLGDVVGIPQKVSPDTESLTNLIGRFRQRVGEPLEVPALSVENSEAVISTAAKSALENPNSPIVQDQTQRLFKRITSEIIEGGLDVPGLHEVQARSGLSETAFAEKFAEQFQSSMSFHGRGLNRLSQLAKAIRKTLPEEEAQRIFGSSLPRTTAFENFRDGLLRVPSKVIQVWRTSLIGQLATAMRNTISQGARVTTNLFEDAMNGVMESVTGKQSIQNAFTPAIEDVAAFMRATGLTRRGLEARKRFFDLLDSQPVDASRFYGTLMGDVTLGGRYTRAVTAFNRMQEFFYRRMVFDASLSAEMKRSGLNPLTAKEIPRSMLEKSVDKALDITFANPKVITAPLSRIANEFPFLYTMGGGFTFPRFWGNAIKFTWDYSPLGLSRLMNPSMLKKLSSPDAREAFSVISQASLGTLLLGASQAIRNSQFAGPRWYEVNSGNGRTIDMRPFQPFSSYLFFAEMMNQAGGIKTGTPLELKDFSEVLGGFRRIAGTGLVLIDAVSDFEKGVSTEAHWKRVQKFIGEFVGGFTVPYRTIKDFMSELSPEDRVVRDIRERPIAGPTLRNLPIMGRTLPEMFSPVRKEVLTTEEPGIRQLTGLTFKQPRTLGQSEIERLGLREFELGQRTGDPFLDRMVVNRMGKFAEPALNRLVSSPGYQQAPDIIKEEAIRKLMSEVRDISRKQFIQEEPLSLLSRVSLHLHGKSKEDQMKEIIKLKKTGLLPDEVLRIMLEAVKIEEKK